ncbi:MAG TPA: MerR family transcriptional regulator [Oscillospiraceae bacterium]|jgi:DNA-binding transcriptional MerR regulator/effector-binding domain-containing protein|nr:MerR family transcriptional regulator [Oscillospiraceae bacterium]HRW56600.1 MerR family transcriptional regulator [Oscillospiraceae bacterium]
MNDDYLSITELAKLRKVSSETLRYYDRINLLKPEYIDPETRYRYYSVRQSEKLGVIRELRELGMSVEEVKDYFKDCNLRKSIRIFSEYYSKLQADIERKLFLCHTIARKLSFLGELTSLKEIEHPCMRYFPERNIITFGEPAGGPKEHVYALTKLEWYLNEIAPILATDCVGVYAGEELLEKNENYIHAIPMLFVDKDAVKVKSEYMRSVPAGDYLCVAYHGGRLEKYDPCFEKAKEYLRDNNLKIKGYIYQIYKIDVTLTGDRSETLLEVQIPVTPK